MAHRCKFTARMLVVVAFGCAVAIVSCAKHSTAARPADDRALVVVTATRQDMVTDVTGTGKIEPVREVAIKSKASGAILHMPVQTGDTVARGALLAQVDTTEAATQVRQDRAELDYQRTQASIADSNLERDTDLLRHGMISREQYDATRLQAAQVRSTIIATEAQLEYAEQALRETTVRAPISGTILDKQVEEGQVITSATSGASEGTTLLTMADLARVRVRVLMAETEISKIVTGQDVTVHADAYPRRTFDGKVEKIEPQATVVRDVTYFPVLVALDNPERLLLPGMNCSVKVHASKLKNVLTISTDAVIPFDEAEKIASVIGVPQDSVDAAIMAAGGHPTGVTSESDITMQVPWYYRLATDRTAQNGPVGAAIVFTVVDTATLRLRPVPVLYGMQDWELTEVREGLKPGELAVIPPSAAVAQQFRKFHELMKQFGGLPGEK